jgi:transcriptional regulator of heat shock response
MPNVRQLGRAIDDSKALGKVLGASETVVIGEDASVIKFDYQVGGETIANIGIIGPDRMDYKSLIGALYSLKNTVEENRKLEGGKNDRKRIN